MLKEMTLVSNQKCFFILNVETIYFYLILLHKHYMNMMRNSCYLYTTLIMYEYLLWTVV